MDEKYVVVEMQTNSDGTVATLTNNFDNLDAAYNKYYTVLAYAAVSTIPKHSAMILTTNGQVWESKYFDHPLLEEE